MMRRILAIVLAAGFSADFSVGAAKANPPKGSQVSAAPSAAKASPERRCRTRYRYRYRCR